MIYCTDKPIRTAGTSVYPYSEVLAKQFEVKPKYGDIINMAVKVGNTLHVPRGLVPLGAEDYRVCKPAIAINCKKPPRSEEQATLIANSVELLRAGYNHVFEAPTGFGKSYCGAAVACAMGQPTLIIVTKEDLVISWRKNLIDNVGLKSDEIGHIQQDVCDYKGKRFVIAMIHSLVSREYHPEMRSYFGMVIFDECHHLAAENFVKACMMFPAVYRLGLSATTLRSDGLWRVIEAHIGPVRVKGTTVPFPPKVLVKKTGWKIPEVTRWVDDPLTGGKMQKRMKIPHGPGRMAGVIKAMAKCPLRNAHVSKFVVDAYKAGRTTLIMSDLLEGHLKPLFHILAKAGIPVQDIDYYVGGRSAAELKTAAHKKVILATYSMVSEGTDYPHWDTAVFASPRANVTQSIGRIMRMLDGKKQPVALDLVDFDAILNGFYVAREKQYYSVQATIVKMDAQ